MARWVQALIGMVSLILLSAAHGAEAEAVKWIVLEVEGQALVSRQEDATWRPAQPGVVLSAGDSFRTLERSRAVVRLTDLSLIRLGELSQVQVPLPTARRGGLQLLRGLLYYFHRDRPGVMPVTTPTAHAVVLGTEFALKVSDDGATQLDLIEGQVEMTNVLGRLVLADGESAIAGQDAAPARVPAIEGTAAIQWVLYYPAVMDPADLDLVPAAQGVMASSISAYQRGDLPASLAAIPVDYVPLSEAERAYVAGVLLAMGLVNRMETMLEPFNDPNDLGSEPGRIAGALRRFVAAIQGRVAAASPAPESSTEWLVESYVRQARGDLGGALEAARESTRISPRFGFAWTRVAELEFSFGRTLAARKALARSLELARGNAQAITIDGFLLAAENKTADALRAFDQAIALNGGLANAWVGRGLCRIRAGDAAGPEDLQVAATLEPQRAILRSYLAKAFDRSADFSRAHHELDLAKELDPEDPTAWLYSALIRHRENRVNASVGELERSKALNENRSVFRSRLLLDQDRAVRSANLAALYQDAGLGEVGAREAATAVAHDYGNSAAHLFLANSFNALRDPNLVQLRYETPTFSEYLLANLLAPVGASPLSPLVSQQEYTRLFEGDRLGFSSETSYTSDGSWAQSASQSGVIGPVGYALDASWRSLQGDHPNTDLEQFVGGGHAKIQLSPRDSVYLMASFAEVTSGDVRQYYDPADASRTFDLDERQEPNVFGGYHHEWAPGVHTLFLGAHLNDTLRVRERLASVRTLVRDENGELTGVLNPGDSTFDLRYRTTLNVWSAELQQIFETPRHLLLVGGRYQSGEVETKSVLGRDPMAFPPVFTDPAAAQDYEDPLVRAAAYSYWHWRVVDPLQLIAGVSYDHLRYPENADVPPIVNGADTSDQVSPKAGFIWTPREGTSVRGAYTRSLGGLSFDSSVRLEPTQVAGFIQSYRSLIPESVEGPLAGAEFETIHLGFDHRFPTRTYVVAEVERLTSEGRRSIGAFDYTDAPPFIAEPTTLRQSLDFEERSLAFSVSQLLGEEWSVGARYRVSDAELRTAIPALPSTLDPTARSSDEAILQQVNLQVLYQHPVGFFAKADAVWRAQENLGDSSVLRDDDFWQFNVWAGWRFARRRVEISAGILNLTDRDYRLNPLNAANELPRERVLATRLRLDF